MTLLNLTGIYKAYGAQTVLEGISLQLHPGDKAGLIGPNGSGKSTLIKIITGELEADSGTVRLSRGFTFGYLPQEPKKTAGGTLRRHLEEPLQSILVLKQEIASLEQAVAAKARVKDGSLNALLERYGELTTRFEELGGYQAESRIAAVAQGLGFAPSDLDRELASFSGGEKTRARLAALLLEESDLLLLDEPTNFLDLGGLEWLERYLREWTRALIVVSHDRYFLDRVAGRIFSLQGGRLKSYSGNYSAYLEQREQERISQEKAFRKQQTLFNREEQLIRESKADERSKRQARSRQKRLKKLEPVERLSAEKTFNLGFDYAGRGGRLVAAFDGVAKHFGPKIIFNDLSFEIHWGDRVALVGPNGAGKSTLLKLISGEEQPTGGTVRLGPSVKVVYFAQEQEQLDPERTVLDEITASAALDLKQARNHLGRYLFRGDDVFKRIRELSGGEKSRLALARLALSSGNFLLMDEPTSHLDLPSMEELEEALSGYPGTLVVVSHDRYFLQRLVNRVIELGAGVNIFNDGFNSYLQTRGNSAAPVSGSGSKEKTQAKLREQLHRQEHLDRQRRERKLRAEQSRLEEAIARSEEKIAGLEAALSDPDRYGGRDHLNELGKQLEEEKTKLSALLNLWEEVGLQL